MTARILSRILSTLGGHREVDGHPLTPRFELRIRPSDRGKRSKPSTTKRWRFDELPCDTDDREISDRFTEEGKWRKDESRIAWQ